MLPLFDTVSHLSQVGRPNKQCLLVKTTKRHKIPAMPKSKIEKSNKFNQHLFEDASEDWTAVYSSQDTDEKVYLRITVLLSKFMTSPFLRELSEFITLINRGLLVIIKCKSKLVRRPFLVVTN